MTKPGLTSHHAKHEHRSSCCPAEPVLAVDRPQAEHQQSLLHIEKMDCPSEESLIRHKFHDVPHISALSFNLLQRKLTVHHAEGYLLQILDDLKEIGLEGSVVTPAGNNNKINTHPIPKTLIAAGVLAFLSEAIHFWGGMGEWPVLALALLSVVLGGFETYKKGWIAIRHVNLNMNALMSIAVTGAMLIGQWPEAAMVMFLFTLAELIEARSMDRARNAISELMKLAPDTVMVQQTDGSWRQQAAEQVLPGSLVKIIPGERVALDGKITAGKSALDQSPITGESVPVEKAEGDMLYAGSINTSATLLYQVTAPASDSSLARIIHAVEAAQGSKAPTQRFVDQFARYYTPVVFLVALLVACVPPLFMAENWLEWVYRALVLLVIACPCALVISTPVTIVSALAKAARNGILIKGGAYLEAGKKLKWIALDKTGTITYGKPVQIDSGLFTDRLTLQQAQILASSLAQESDHPVSVAIAKYAQQQGTALAEVQAFKAIAGRGTEGSVAGTTYWLGNRRLMQESGHDLTAVAAQLEQLEQQGHTLVLLADKEQLLAWYGVADTVKETSKEAIAQLHQLGVRTAMLSGDNNYVAQAIAAQVGVDQATGNLLPQDKLALVKQQQQYGVVGMIGDGINDAPALAQADIGFAMGAVGSDTAVESADVALMDDDLRKVPLFIRLSKATSDILIQNITLALGIKAIFLVLTFTGQATMWMAVFADMGASLLVVFNGLRLLRWKG